MRKVVLTTGFPRSYFWTPENGETLLEKSSPTFVDVIKGAIERGDAGIKAPPAAAFGVEEKDRK